MKTASNPYKSVQDKTLAKASLFLEHLDSGFVIIEVNEPILQQKAAAYLTEHVTSKKILNIDLKSIPPDADHLSVIRQKVSENPNVSVLLILNFHALAERIETKEIGLVRDLNFSREPYASLNKIFVFFMPSFFVDLLIRHARDFYDYVPIKFELMSEIPSGWIWQNKPSDTADEIFLKNRILFLQDLINTGELSEPKKAEILYDLAKCLSELYQHDEAIRRYQEARVLYRKLNRKGDESVTLNNISEIYYARGDYDTALEYLKQSLSILREIGDRAGMCATLFNMGHISMTAENMQEALMTWAMSYRIAKQIGHAQVLAALDNLAKQLGQSGLQYWE